MTTPPTKKWYQIITPANILVIILALAGALAGFIVVRESTSSARADIEELKAVNVREVEVVHVEFVTKEKLGDVIKPMERNIERIETRQMSMDGKMDRMMDEIRKIPKG